VNREGQRWTDDRPGMTLRLPIDLREAVTEESRVKGDLARIVLFALSHVEREKVDIMQTRKAGMELSNPQLLHVGAEARNNAQGVGRSRRRQRECDRGQRPRRVLQAPQEEQGAPGRTAAGDSCAPRIYARRILSLSRIP
jgi:hypothetical protein